MECLISYQNLSKVMDWVERFFIAGVREIFRQFYELLCLVGQLSEYIFIALSLAVTIKSTALKSPSAMDCIFYLEPLYYAQNHIWTNQTVSRTF